MRKRTRIYLLLFVMVFGVITGCANWAPEQEEAQNTSGKETEIQTENIIPEYVSSIKGIEKYKEKIDYSAPENWMELPEQPDKDVDVIYLYPTVYGTLGEATDDIADIDDPSMRMLAIYTAVSQAGVFEESCNVYAPYYRQFTVESLLDMIENSPESLPYCASQDIYRMLDYYFESLNEGRPFILAGHSQGSVWLTVILEDYMKQHPEYLDRMVAAYVIGYSVTEDYLARNPHLKFAQGKDDTGVIVSYNTEGTGNKNQYNCVVKEGAVAINPINWKRDDTYAPAEENRGSLTATGGIARNYADARLDTERGVVICDTVKISSETQAMLGEYFGTESFHLQDYSLYFMNLQQNVEDRINAFMAQ